MAMVREESAAVLSVLVDLCSELMLFPSLVRFVLIQRQPLFAVFVPQISLVTICMKMEKQVVLLFF